MKRKHSKFLSVFLMLLLAVCTLSTALPAFAFAYGPDPAPHVALDDTGWVQVDEPDTFVDDLTSFVIDSSAVGGNPAYTYTGHLRIGSLEMTLGAATLTSASYYITRNDGEEDANIGYAYSYNGFSTSGTYAFFGEPEAVELELFNTPVQSIWTKDRAPGYTMVQLRGEVLIQDQVLEVRVTMIPYVNGHVRHSIEVTNPGQSALDLGFVQKIDTELHIDSPSVHRSYDNVPVYSLGTDKGMYIDDSSVGTRVLFPFVPTSDNGPDTYRAFRWSAGAGGVIGAFGADLDHPGDAGVPRALGEVLLSGVDTAIYYRWEKEELAPGETRSLDYIVSLSEDYSLAAPVITNVIFDSPVLQGDPFDADVVWVDYDSDTQELYYLLDGEPAVHYVTTTDDPIPFSLDTTDLEPGEHSLCFYVIDPDGNVSNRYPITFEVLESDRLTSTTTTTATTLPTDPTDPTGDPDATTATAPSVVTGDGAHYLLAGLLVVGSVSFLIVTMLQKKRATL